MNYKSNKNRFFIILRNLAFMIVLGFVISFLFFSDVDNWLNSLVYILYFSATIGFLFWQGSVVLTKILDKKLPWEKEPMKRLIITLLIMIIYMIVVIFIVNFVLSVFILGKDYSEYFSNVTDSIILQLVITILITWIIYSISFFKNWRNLKLQEEKMKNKMLELEYEALKNQVNPHFLFNSLNVLTALVTDNEDAVLFIKKLSDVYRYILEQKSNEIIDLKTELEFTDSYIYLHKIRFGENLIVNNNVYNTSGKIVPLSLQMVVENAIKHNIVSPDDPLTIEIFNKDDYLYVINNLQYKINRNSSGIGLKNIKSRYKYLSKQTFEYKKTEKQFIVKIPIIK